MPHGLRHPIDDEINRANRSAAAGRPAPNPTGDPGLRSAVNQARARATAAAPNPPGDPSLRRTARRFGAEASQAREAAAANRRARPTSGGGGVRGVPPGSGPTGGGSGGFLRSSKRFLRSSLRGLPVLGIGIDAAARGNQLNQNIQQEGGFSAGLRRTQEENVEGSLMDLDREDQGFVGNLRTAFGLRSPDSTAVPVEQDAQPTTAPVEQDIQPTTVPVEQDTGGLRRFTPQTVDGNTRVSNKLGEGVIAQGGLDAEEADRISRVLNQPNPNPRSTNEVAMEESRRRLVGLQNRLDNMTGNRADLPRRRAELIKQIEQEQLLQSDLAANVSSERQQQIASDSLVAQEYIKKQPTAADRAAAMRDLESAIGQKLDNDSTAESRFADVLADTNVEGVFRNEDGTVDRASAGQYLASVRSAGIPIPANSQDMQTFANTIKLSQDLSEQAQRSTRFFGSGALGTLGAAVQEIASLGIAEPGVPTPPASDVYRQLVDFVKFRAEAAENRRKGINEATFRGQQVVLDDRVWGLVSGGLEDATKDQMKSFEMANRSLLKELEQSIAGAE